MNGMKFLWILIPIALIAGYLLSGNSFQKINGAAQEHSTQEKQNDKAVNDKLNQLEYFINHDKCFIDYAVCLGEGKHDKKACWSVHEACVVAVYRQWKQIKNN